MKTIAYTMVGRTCVFVYGETASDDEWEAYLTYRCSRIDQTQGVLVYTRGGSATVKQRARLGRMSPQLVTVRGAVVTSSSYVRALYRAIEYPTWAVFPETEWGYAFRHLGVEGADRLTLFSTVVTLSERLGLPTPSTYGFMR